MLYLKCTQAVQKAIGLRKEELALSEPTTAPLGNWYVNCFDLSRQKAYIFMSETTLLSFIFYQGKMRPTIESLPILLLGGLEQLLQMRGLPLSAIDRALEHYGAGLYAKTNSKADLGSMSDLVLNYQWVIMNQGGLSNCDLTSIIMKANDIPQRRLGWQTSWDAVQSRLCLAN